MAGYLESQTLRLFQGMSRCPQTLRDRQAGFLQAAQQPDGGFAGRRGASDPYYTGFGVRALALIGRLDGEPATRAALYTRRRFSGESRIIDVVSLAFAGMTLRFAGGVDPFDDGPADWRGEVTRRLNELCRADGGYANGPGAERGSTYFTFLALLCSELAGQSIPKPQAAVDFILSQKRDDGGFVEIASMSRSGTNPSAAAVGALKILDALDASVSEDVAIFLSDMQTAEGGLRANTRIPVADLLSTFTAVQTLSDLDSLDRIDVAAAMRYVKSLEEPAGGFRAATPDDEADVEYTFYGLGSLALLGPFADHQSTPGPAKHGGSDC